MSAYEPVRDDRLHSWPKVFRHGDDVRLSVRVMTPLRLAFLHETLRMPFFIIWFFTMILLAFDWCCAQINAFLLFHSFPFSRTSFLIVMLVLLVLWLVEGFCGYPLSRRLFGRKIDIRVSDKQITVKAGFSTTRFSRSQKLSFVQIPFHAPASTVYQNSQGLCLIVGDARRVKIAEIFGTQKLEQIVSNANVALGLASSQSDLDVNPVAQRLARLENEDSARRPHVLKRLWDAL